MDELRAVLAERIAMCRARREALIADDRGDEAVFARVQENVYELFRTVLETAVKTQGDSARGFFRKKLDEIPENWRKSLKAAMEHSDADKIQIEIMKLEAASDVAAIMERVWGMEHD